MGDTHVAANGPDGGSIAQGDNANRHNYLDYRQLDPSFRTTEYSYFQKFDTVKNVGGFIEFTSNNDPVMML